MIYFLVGENLFTRSRALADITNKFEGDIQVVDGENVSVTDLPDLFMATSLFANRRLVVIHELSANASIWGVLPDWLNRLSENVDVAVVETKPDRRTVTFKELKKQGILQEFPLWQTRDETAAASWLLDEAKGRGLLLDQKHARMLVERVGLDQYQLGAAIEKLSLSGEAVTKDLIERLIDSTPVANVFSLLEAAFEGKTGYLTQLVDTLKLTGQDPYQVFGLLTTQLFQLSAVFFASADDNVTTDFSIHPYVVKKLQGIKKRLSRTRLQEIITAFFDADIAMKTTSTDPWLLINRLLAEVAKK